MHKFIKTLLTLFLLTSTTIHSENQNSAPDLKEEIPSLPSHLDRPSKCIKFLISYYEETETLTKQMTEFRKNASEPIDTLMEFVEKHQTWLKDAVFRLENFVSYIELNAPVHGEVQTFFNRLMKEYFEYDTNRRKLLVRLVRGQMMIPAEAEVKMINQKNVFFERSSELTTAIRVLAQSDIFLHGFWEDEPTTEDFDLLHPLVNLMEKFEACLDRLTNKNVYNVKGELNEDRTVCAKFGRDQDNYIKRHRHFFQSFLGTIYRKKAVLKKIFVDVTKKFNKVKADYARIKEQNDYYENDLIKLMDAVWKSGKTRTQAEL